MKTLTSLFIIVLLSFSTIVFAHTKSETLKVSGECGMCKKKIETAAKQAGATYAEWNTDSKILTVKYTANSTNKAKIEQAVAGVGYDTPSVKATSEAYEKLHGCCKYDRSGTTSAQSCCESEKCTAAACMKDGKCIPEASCCKDAGCDKKDCCKKA